MGPLEGRAAQENQNQDCGRQILLQQNRGFLNGVWCVETLTRLSTRGRRHPTINRIALLSNVTRLIFLPYFILTVLVPLIPPYLTPIISRKVKLNIALLLRPDRRRQTAKHPRLHPEQTTPGNKHGGVASTVCPRRSRQEL